MACSTCGRSRGAITMSRSEMPKTRLQNGKRRGLKGEGSAPTWRRLFPTSGYAEARL